VFKNISIKTASFARYCLWFLIVASAATIVSGIIARCSANLVWDDAYMLVRYADNILASKTIAWNPNGEPTYGFTSIGFLGIVLSIRMLWPHNAAFTAFASSSLCGLAFIFALMALLCKQIPDRPLLRLAIIALVLFSMALAVSNLTIHFASGMDTTFALAFLTTYLILITWQARASSSISAWLTAIWGGLAFPARPDLLVYTLGLPLAVIVFSKDAQARRRGVLILASSTLMTLVEIFFFAQYFHSPLPLPFYAKTQGIYGEYIRGVYRSVPLRQLYDYVLSFPILVLVVLAAAIIDLREWWQSASAITKGLLFSSLAFAGYYLLFVLQIMPYGQRFYYPTFPALALLAAQSAIIIMDKTRPLYPSPSVIQASSLARKIPMAVLAALLFFLLPQARNQATRIRDSITGGEMARFNLLAEYKSQAANYWFCLDQFSALSDDLMIATTEVGYPAAMNPRKAVIDLSGLNETTIAHSGFSAETFFQQYQPDLIYMPHPHYKEMIQQITNNPYFIAHYELLDSPQTAATLGTALRRDSLYYASMRQLADECSKSHR